MDRQPKESKVNEVKNLASKLKEAKSAVFVNYTGMGVKTQQELKKKLRESGSTMLVAKNTLLRLASKEADFPEDSFNDNVLSGQTALVISDSDAVSPIQILGKFASEFELPEFKAGVVEGNFTDADGLKKISKLPNRETLYAQVVGSMQSPMYGLVGTLQGNLQKLVWILQSRTNS